MIKTKRIDMRLWLIASLIIIMGMLLLFPASVHAAGEGTLKAKEDCVKLGIGEIAVVTIECADMPNGLGDLAVVSANPEIAVGTISQAKNGNVNLAIGAQGTGTTNLAVYRVSNPAVVTYVAVLSGMPEKGQIVTQINGDAVTTTYEDCIVHYGTILKGKNDAQLTVGGIVLERESNIDCLKVTGVLSAKDNKFPGMNTFYANFYDPSGKLIKRQAVYNRDPAEGAEMTLEWYVPYGSAQIVIE